MRFADSLSVYSGGESTGEEAVNFLSNWETSSSLVKVGLNGGSNFRDMTSCHLMCLKNEWLLICSASDGAEPNLWETCLWGKKKTLKIKRGPFVFLCFVVRLNLVDLTGNEGDQFVPWAICGSSPERPRLNKAEDSVCTREFSQSFFYGCSRWTVAAKNRGKHLNRSSRFDLNDSLCFIDLRSLPRRWACRTSMYPRTTNRRLCHGHIWSKFLEPCKKT